MGLDFKVFLTVFGSVMPPIPTAAVSIQNLKKAESCSFQKNACRKGKRSGYPCLSDFQGYPTLKRGSISELSATDNELSVHQAEKYVCCQAVYLDWSLERMTRN